MVKVLFVCMGNICRSPTAEGVFRDKVTKAGFADDVVVDSAGTHAYHTAQPPDIRAQSIALERGIDLSGLHARSVQLEDFEKFDHIMAMDAHNRDTLALLCSGEFEYKIKYMMDYAPQWKTREVPDPYYGGQSGFARVIEMLDDAADGFLDQLSRIEL